RERRSRLAGIPPFGVPPARASGGVFHSRQVSSPVTFPRHMPDPGSTPAATRYLVDGYALIYRAFFAMIARPLSTRRGETTSAAWGITNFLLRLLEQRRPDYLAWVHVVGVSFRRQAYPQYKATREKLTQELQQEFDRSVERIEEILEAFHVPLVGVEGYEADDVICTLA